MSTIQKITMNSESIGKGIAKKALNRAALPAASTLALLAGSSMSGGNKPDNAGNHESGSSVDDSAWEQIKHVGEMAKDAGEAILDAILDLFDD